MDCSPNSASKLAKGEGSSPVTRKPPLKYDKSLVNSKVRIWWPEDYMYYEGVIESFDAAKKKHKVLYVNGEKETLNLKTEKWEILKEYFVRDEANDAEPQKQEVSCSSDSDAEPQKQKGKKVAAAKEVKLPPRYESEDDNGRKFGSGKNATENDQAKAMSSDDEVDYLQKSAAKSAKGEGSSKEIPMNSAKRKRSAVKDKVSDTIKYYRSLVGSKVKVWWPEDKMYFEGFIESFDAARKMHKVHYVDGEKETLNLKTEKWEILKEYSVCDEANYAEPQKWEASCSRDSDAEPKKRTGKKAAAAKEVKLQSRYKSEDDESDAPPLKMSVSKSMKQSDKKSKLSGKKMDVGGSNAKNPKQTGKKVNAKVGDSDSEANPMNLSFKKGQKSKPTAEEEEESDSEDTPLKLSATNGKSKKKDDGRKCGSGKNATENDQAKAKPSANEMDYSQKSAEKSAKGEGSSKEMLVNSGKRKLSAVKNKGSNTIKYDKSLVGSKVKVWWPEDKMYYEGFIESFDAAKKKHKVHYVEGEKETLNLKTEKWEFLEEYSVHDEGQTIEAESEEASPEIHKKKKAKTDVTPSASEDQIKDSAKRTGGVSSSGKTKGPTSKDNKSKDKSAAKSTSKKSTGKSSDAATSSKSKDEETPKAGSCALVPVIRKLGEGVLFKSEDKLNTYLIPALISMGDMFDNYPKVEANKCKLVKESIYKAHQDYESNLTTTSSDHTCQLEGACLGVDVTGSQEASLDLETSNKSEEEVINQKGHDKKHTNGTNTNKESKTEDQASKKRGKEDDTVINSTESMVGLAPKRASRETSESMVGLAEKIRVSRVAGGSSLAPPPVTCSTDATVEEGKSDRIASGHLPLGDKDVIRYPSHQMFLPGASAPTMEERVRQTGLSGVVDRLQGMATALFSHSAESIHGLELDNSELKGQLNELVLRDKGYHEKISVLEGKLADLKSQNVQMKITFEARAVDANRRATEAERRFAEAKRKMEVENLKLKKQLDECVLCNQGYKEKICILEREVADMKSLDEQMKLNLEARAVDAERRVAEAEKRLAEAKRKMVEAEGTVKAALASFAL